MANGAVQAAAHDLSLVGHRLSNEFSRLVLSPWAWAAFAGILAVEVARPAQRRQRVFCRGLRHDAVWLAASLASSVLTLAVIVALQNAVRAAGGFHLDMSGVAPPAVLGAGAFVLGDLLAWVEHLIQHKWSLLWRFHAVHHVQPELNMFTAARHHFVEYALSPIATFLPFIVLGLDQLAPITALVVAREWHARLVHANVRSDFGPLRYVFVTPQSHRIHHSTDPRHFDRNLGAVFSVWDRIFRTSWAGHTEYPDTGFIGYARSESDVAAGALRSFWRDTVTPFVPARSVSITTPH